MTPSIVATVLREGLKHQLAFSDDERTQAALRNLQHHLARRFASVFQQELEGFFDVKEFERCTEVPK